MISTPATLSQYTLTIAFLILLFGLIALFETVALQALRWGNFRRALQGAFWMNLASALPVLLAFSQVPRLGFFGLLIGWAVSVAIEYAVLNHMQPGAKRYTLALAASANIVSFLLLILPAYLSSVP